MAENARSTGQRLPLWHAVHRFEFEPLLVPFAAALGVVPSTARVEVDEHRLLIRFGPWSLSTAVDNVAGTTETGPYRFVKVAGPPHLSFADGGVTFATNRRRGLCIRFHEPVRAIEPTGRLRHPAATVTVADPAQLAADLRAVAVPAPH
jgi:hypothetical protein